MDLFSWLTSGEKVDTLDKASLVRFRSKKEKLRNEIAGIIENWNINTPLDLSVPSPEDVYQARSGRYSSFSICDFDNLSVKSTDLLNLTKELNGEALMMYSIEKILTSQPERQVVVWDIGSAQAGTLVEIKRKYNDKVICIGSNLRFFSASHPYLATKYKENGIVPLSFNTTQMHRLTTKLGL